MKLPRLTSLVGITDGNGKPGSRFQTIWNAICDAIEASAPVDSPVFTTQIVIPTHTPANHADTGVTGQIAWDANFLYVCVAPNSWKRVAIAAW